MRCFTTCPMANFALRMGGWRIADPATWFSSSMAEVLLRRSKQATRWTGEFREAVQEYVEFCNLAVPYMYAKTRPELRQPARRFASVDASGRPVDCAAQGYLGTCLWLMV